MRKLINDDTNKEILIGERMKDFRGDEWIYEGITGLGKVYVTSVKNPMAQEMFPSVFRCSIMSS